MFKWFWTIFSLGAPAYMPSPLSESLQQARTLMALLREDPRSTPYTPPPRPLPGPAKDGTKTVPTPLHSVLVRENDSTNAIVAQGVPLSLSDG